MKRRGFTLVELLVVIAIIGVLVGLLLPAVQAAREAARRMQCSNNVKQIALSLHNYVDANKKFPAAGRGYGMCPTMPANGEVKNSNGLVSLLPFMEQGALYNKFNHSQAFSDHNVRSLGTVVGSAVTNGNGLLSGIELAMFACPSDNNPALHPTLTNVPHYGPGGGLQGCATNYDFIVNAADFGKSMQWAGDSNRRMFGEESKATFGDIADGTSNTFMVGETTRRHVNGCAFAWAYRAWVMVGIDPWYGGTNGGINVWNQPWIHPTWQSPPFIPIVGRARSWWCAAASLHSGGAMFGLGDGSVHFVSQSTDFETLRRLSLMGDGQVVNIAQ